MAVSVSINTLSALTDKYYIEELHDNFFLSRAFNLKLKSRERPKSGGDDIRVPIKHGNNTNGGRWAGDDAPLNTAGQEFATQATFDWRYLQAAVSLPETRILRNMGKGRIVDLLAEEVENAQETIVDQFDIDLFKDGTADSAGVLGIAGLAAVLTRASNPTPGAYGGITRVGASGSKNSPTGNAFWNANVQAANSNSTVTHYKNDVTMDNSAVMTLAKLQAIFGVCGGGDLIVTSQLLYDKYWSLLTTIQRQMTDDEIGKAGFTSLMFNNAPVIVADNIDNQNKWIVLNMKFFELCPHKDMNFSATEFRKPPNQRTLIKLINWMGNLICKRPNRQGMLTGMTA